MVTNTHTSPGVLDGGTPKNLAAALWAAQALLALFFLMAGFSHAFRPISEAARMAPWVADVPEWLPRFIGVAELAGAVGIVLPAATRIRPTLTPLAALGFLVIMGLAIPFHVMRGEAKVIGMHFAVAGLAAFVAWGRLAKAPIEPRG